MCACVCVCSRGALCLHSLMCSMPTRAWWPPMCCIAGPLRKGVTPDFLLDGVSSRWAPNYLRGAVTRVRNFPAISATIHDVLAHARARPIAEGWPCMHTHMRGIALMFASFGDDKMCHCFYPDSTPGCPSPFPLALAKSFLTYSRVDRPAAVRETQQKNRCSHLDKTPLFAHQ